MKQIKQMGLIIGYVLNYRKAIHNWRSNHNSGKSVDKHGNYCMTRDEIIDKYRTKILDYVHDFVWVRW